VILALLGACFFTPEGAEGAEDAPLAADDAALEDPGDCERDPPVSWDNYAHGFVTRYCTSCHSSQLAGADRSGAPAGLDLDSEAAVRAYGGAIRANTLGDDPSMPPGGGPDAAELSLLDEWLTCSAS